MKDRKFHNKKLPGDYPVPRVPADDAWTAMNSLLDGAQEPPKPHGMPGSSKIFLYLSLLAVVISVFVLISRNWQKIESDKIKATTLQQSTILPHDDTNKEVAGIGSTTTRDNNATNILQQSQPGNATNNTTNSEHTTLLPGDKMAAAEGTSLKNNAQGHSITATSRRRNEPGKKNNNGQHFQLAKDAPGHHYAAGNKGAVFKGGITKSNSQQGDLAFTDVQQTGATALVKEPVAKIEYAESLDITGLTSSIAALLKSHVQVTLDSSYFQKSKENAEKGSKPLTGKSKTINQNKTGIDYGLQWQVPFPVQGTKNYFRGTNGKSKPYNLLLPQIWVSKGINNKNKLILTINLNEQYFIREKQLRREMMFMAPRDTGVNTVNLYKISGFGGTIAWSYEINNHWAASLGINYMLNRTALVDKQTTNIYTGSVISDSLYGINRHSAEWSYINKNMLAAQVELSYIFNKLSVGASASVPLSNIPLYNDTKIHPLNAHLFLRWNIKK